MARAVAAVACCGAEALKAVHRPHKTYSLPFCNHTVYYKASARTMAAATVAATAVPRAQAACRTGEHPHVLWQPVSGD